MRAHLSKNIIPMVGYYINVLIMVWFAKTNQGVGLIKAVNIIKVDKDIIVAEARDNFLI